MGRVDYKKEGEYRILAMNYFFKKNLQHNIFNCLWYIWLNIGFIVYGILLEIFVNNFEIEGYIKGLINKVSGVKKALRQQNSGLDGFLYRWGYYDTLVHPDNKNYERVWETTGFIAPDVYQNGLRKFKPNI